MRFTMAVRVICGTQFYKVFKGSSFQSTFSFYSYRYTGNFMGCPNEASPLCEIARGNDAASASSESDVCFT